MEGRREYPSRPLVGAGIIVRRDRDQKVLLIKRKFPPNEGRWSLPGGMVELGETPRDAATREVKEETGLKVVIEKLFDVGSDIHFGSRSKPKYHFVLIDYVAKYTGGKVRLNQESSSYGWFSFAEMVGLDMSAGTTKVLKRFFRQDLSTNLRSARRPLGKRSS